MTCPECDGTGKVTEDGEQVTCPECGGTGQIPDEGNAAE